MDGKSNGSKAGMYKNLKAKDRHENENSCHFYWKVVLKDLKKHGIIEENFKFSYPKSTEKHLYLWHYFKSTVTEN